MRDHLALPVRWRLAGVLAAIVLLSGGLLLIAAWLLMDAQLHRTLSATAADAAGARLRGQFALALTGAVLAAAVLGWMAAGRALAPLRRVAAAARRVSPDELDERVALRGPRDELREVADTFDGMLERLGGAFDAQRRFVGHAAHELRRPLTAMRAELDVTLSDPDADVRELRRMAGAVSTAVDRCEELVAGLLTLARGEAVGVGDEPADLGRAARLALGDVGPDARSRRLAMTTDLQAAPVRGDRRLLERLVANLVENAVCHNVHGGRVEVTTGVRGDRAHVRVENTGAPIAPERVPRLLEPFVRGGEGGAAGSGLGLAIVRTIARAHGGAIVLTSRPGGGLVAEAVLPLRTGAPALASAPDRVDGRFGRRVRAPAR